jgi:hypothetical protein
VVEGVLHPESYGWSKVKRFWYSGVPLAQLTAFQFQVTFVDVPVAVTTGALGAVNATG